jgi:hypothetical protein
MKFPVPETSQPLAGWCSLTLLLPLLGVAAPVAAQEYQPIVRARELPRMDERVQAGRAAWRDIEGDGKTKPGFNLRLAVSAAYDDNIFLSATDPKADTVVTVVPQMAYSTGPGEGADGAYAKAAYLPALVIYHDNSGSNRVDHDVQVAAGWRGKALAFAYEGGLRRLGDATADTGAPADRYEYRNIARVAWQLRGKFALETAVGISGTHYDNRAYIDNRQLIGEASLVYEYSPKTRLAIVYLVGREQIAGSGDQSVQRLLCRIAWQPREKISVDLAAGIEHRSYDLGSGNEPLLESRIGWRLREGTEIQISGFLREEASGFFAGQNYQLANLSAGVSQTLGHGWTARLDGGIERASYFRVSGGGPTDRVDRILFIQPALEYTLSDTFRIGLFHRFSENSSSDDGFGYEDQQTGVRMEYNF